MQTKEFYTINLFHKHILISKKTLKPVVLKEL
jgi:hypothetical protein